MATQSLPASHVLSYTIYLEYTIAGLFGHHAISPFRTIFRSSIIVEEAEISSRPPVVLLPNLIGALVIISHESY